uniref:Ig-like domain-containing protein n=1 Tax=Maylandia zebra TaxID=106582 RepID=A0A3P9DCV9_9CICH
MYARLSPAFAAPSTNHKTITAKSGQNVILTCQTPNNNILVVEWSRADLGDEYVFVFRDGQFDPANQHPSFKNRVGLQDRQMKDGDVSLILKDVTTSDAGTYECRVIQIGATRSNTGHINIISLKVVPPAASWLLMFVSKDVVDETLRRRRWIFWTDRWSDSFCCASCCCCCRFCDLQKT